MYARTLSASDDGSPVSLSFEHTTCLFEISFTPQNASLVGKILTQVAIKADNGATLAGTFTQDITQPYSASNQPVFSQTQDSVTLQLQNVTVPAVGNTIKTYIVINPAYLTTVTVYYTIDGQVQRAQKTFNKQLNRQAFYTETVTATPPTPSGSSVSALFLGNSYTSQYTYDVPLMTQQVAASAGDNLTYTDRSQLGYRLSQHAADATTTNLIQTGGWDFVILQEQSQLPSEPIATVIADCYPYAHTLSNRIKRAGAQPLFYITWGRKNGDSDRCSFHPAVCTYVEMDDLTTERYLTMAEDNDADAAPVAQVWRYLRNYYPSITLYDYDESHTSLEGAYAAACTFYVMLFGKDPTAITETHSIPATTASIIRTAVKTVVFDSLSSWRSTAFQSGAASSQSPGLENPTLGGSGTWQ